MRAPLCSFGHLIIRSHHIFAGVVKGGFENKSKRKANEKASLASSSIACDGKRLFINFLHDNAVFTTALDMQGNVLWQQKITDYIVHQGYGSSPAVYGPLVVVSADNKVETRVFENAQVSGNHWLVTSGISDGDKLIVDGFQWIGAGAPVQPVEAKINENGIVEEAAAPAAAPAAQP